MTEYYEEKWLDNVEERFETIVKASQRARKMNEGIVQDSATIPKKVVVEALREVVQEESGVVAEEKPAQSKEEGPAE